MPQIKCNFAFVFLVGLTIGFSACTDAKRWLDDKPVAKTTATPLKGDPGLAIKPSPSPTVSASAKSTTISAVAFTGDIAGKTGRRMLYQLLEKNDKKPVKLDVLLSDEQLAQMDDVDKGKRWYFDLAYEGEDGFNTGGELLIDITKGKGDLRLNGNHLTGNIVVTNWTGPKQGLMSILAKPANRETTNAKSDEPSNDANKDAPKPKPTEAKKKQGVAENPPN